MFFLTFIIFTPVLFLFTAIIKNNKIVSNLTRYWSRTSLMLSGIVYEIEFEEKLNNNYQYIFCPNHVSTLDIPLITAIIPLPLIYMGKSELTKIPLFGYFYKHINEILNKFNIKKSKYNKRY